MIQFELTKDDVKRALNKFSQNMQKILKSCQIEEQRVEFSEEFLSAKKSNDCENLQEASRILINYACQLDLQRKLKSKQNIGINKCLS